MKSRIVKLGMNLTFNFIRRKPVSEILDLLSKSDRKKVALVAILHVIFGFLDLIGVATIGVLSAIAIRGIKSQTPGDKVGRLLESLGMQDWQLKSQIIFFAVLATGVFVSKTIFSVIFLRKTLRFLSNKSALITSDLVSKLFTKPFDYILSENLQQRLFCLTTGVSNLTVGVISNIVLIAADSSMLIVLLVGLLVVDPAISVITFSFFISVGILLHLLLNVRASKIGQANSRLSIRSNQTIIEALSTYKELLPRGSKEFYINAISDERLELAKLDSELKFFPYITKYTAEITIILGFTAIAAFQFSRSDNNHAISVLSVFLAASSRIAPAIMRIQQSTISIKSYLASSEPTLALAKELKGLSRISKSPKVFSIQHPNFIPEVKVDSVNFTYLNAKQRILDNISATFSAGNVTALVGPSGGGKSTLVDSILGSIRIESGKILISNVDVLQALETWSGAIGYVPQKTYLINGTIKQNICLGYNPSEIDDELVWECLEKAELKDFVNNLPTKLDYLVSDNGENLSGGQRQRIGIARALITKPKLIILDEATSALDAETENKIMDSILKLRNETTIILVAHRLSTVKSADRIYYVKDGKVESQGTFEDLKELNSDFRYQAGLMGL